MLSYAQFSLEFIYQLLNENYSFVQRILSKFFFLQTQPLFSTLAHEILKLKETYEIQSNFLIYRQVNRNPNPGLTSPLDFGTDIDFWHSQTSHLIFILINYLTLSPGGPCVFWTHLNSVTELLLFPNPFFRLKTCFSSLVNIAPFTRCHPWFGCHLDSSPPSQPSPVHLLICPVSGFSLSLASSGHQYLFLEHHTAS